MRLLVVGGSGLLGFKVAQLAIREFETFATFNYRPMEIQGCKFVKLDKTKRDNTLAFVKDLRPDIVIDTAALHNVNYCETHRKEAWIVNVQGTKNIAEACRKVDAKMIFVSTDYVFDGTRGFYTEEDTPNPLNYYAKTKLEGEVAVEKTGINYAIARPSVIFGWSTSEVSGIKSSSGKSINFALWTYRQLKSGRKISIVSDQYSCPTLADNLAEVLLILSTSDNQGIYHTTGRSCINRYDFARKIADTFQLNSNLIEPVTSDFFSQVAKRPKRCCLDVSKAERELKVRFLSVKEGLIKMKKQMKE